jgi:hypothetical protein
MVDSTFPLLGHILVCFFVVPTHRPPRRPPNPIVGCALQAVGTRMARAGQQAQQRFASLFYLGRLLTPDTPLFFSKATGPRSLE